MQSGTHTLNKIVKCVFGVDRRRASAYALALRVAATKKITVESLPAFIRDAGGVEEVRRTAAEVNHNIISAPQKVAIASDAVAQMSIAVISGEQLGMALDLGNIGKNVVLLGTWQADGSVVVRAVVQNDSAVNSALAGYYSSNKGAVQAKATEAVAANDANLVQQAINQAAAA